MIGLAHILTDSDVRGGIQALAAKLLDDQDLAPDLINANNLIPPYLTMDPVQVYGQPLDVESTSSSLSAGDQQLALSASLQLWQQGDTVVFASSSATGLTIEAQIVQNYDGATLKWASGLLNNYPQGSQILSFAPMVIQSQILMPGNILFLPINELPSGTFVLTTGGQLTDALGSDAAAPLSWSNGDIATVSGTATLTQRMRAVLGTLIASLPQSPGWGSLVSKVVGKPTNATQIKAYATQALLSLPEITQVTGQAVTVAGNAIYFSCTAIIATTNTPLAVANEPLTSPISN